jgi:hypothetical protein
MPYVWKSLRFELPQGLLDQTALTFVDEQQTHQITVTLDEKAGAFAAYVETQLKEVASALPGYQLVAKNARNVNGKDAVVVEQKATAQAGTMRQLQAYVDFGGQVAIVTASHLDKPSKKSALEAVKGAEQSPVDAAFEKILNSLSA